MRRLAARVPLLTLVIGLVGCAPDKEATAPALVGAWRSAITFQSGAFEGIPNLEFLYVFNLGGTMTESSNYDGAPPVPPAYGVWRQTGPNTYEARYDFFVTKPPDLANQLPNGWAPAGRGVFHETITLAADGQSFTSTIRYDAFDLAGSPVAGGGQASGKATRITLPASATR